MSLSPWTCGAAALILYWEGQTCTGEKHSNNDSKSSFLLTVCASVPHLSNGARKRLPLAVVRRTLVGLAQSPCLLRVMFWLRPQSVCSWISLPWGFGSTDLWVIFVSPRPCISEAASIIIFKMKWRFSGEALFCLGVHLASLLGMKKSLWPLCWLLGLPASFEHPHTPGSGDSL